MSIKEFIVGLTPNLERSRIMDTLDSTKGMLINDTLAAYKDSVQYGGFTSPQPFRTSEIKKFNAIFQKETGAGKNFIVGTSLVLSQLAEGFPLLEKVVNQQFKSSAMNKLGLTYQKATVLRLLSQIRFTSRYARRALHYMYSKETPSAFKQLDATPAFSPGEVKWLEENAVVYCRLIKLFAEPMNKILAKVESIPDAIFDVEKDASVEAVVGARKMDPLGLGFVPVISDIIWFFGSRWVEYQAAELEEAREERLTLELRLAQLRSAQNGENDAAQDKVIKVNEQRLRDVTYKVLKLSKDYGVDADF